MAKENQCDWMHLRLYLYCVERCYRDAPIPNSPEFQMEPHQQCKQARFCQLSHKANYRHHGRCKKDSSLSWFSLLWWAVLFLFLFSQAIQKPAHHLGLAEQVSPEQPSVILSFSAVVRSLFFLQINSQYFCNLSQNAVNICIQTCSFFLILLDQFLRRQNFFFLVRISAEINVVCSVR